MSLSCKKRHYNPFFVKFVFVIFLKKIERGSAVKSFYGRFQKVAYHKKTCRNL